MFIDNGKKPDEPYNAALGFWLPPDSPYGNFQLKYMKIIQRLDESNRYIASSYDHWNLCQTGSVLTVSAFERHVFANESAIYMLRRAADELISLIWCLSKYEKDKAYPLKIKVDRLGAVLAQSEDARHEAFTGHVELMELLNDISNAFKHSFINSNHSLLGENEPRVHALGLAYNKLAAEPEFYDVSLSTIIEKYNDFYQSCVSWLSSYSERNR